MYCSLVLANSFDSKWCSSSRRLCTAGTGLCCTTRTGSLPGNYDHKTRTQPGKGKSRCSRSDMNTSR